MLYDQQNTTSPAQQNLLLLEWQSNISKALFLLSPLTCQHKLETKARTQRARHASQTKFAHVVEVDKRQYRQFNII
jgi:hypothetical protein